ncbi:MAG: hypothetical protein ACI8QZ_003421 [Chlamydiales bacterium]|jgi:hypothetical protein
MDALLADTLVVLHLVVVIFMIGGVLGVLIGWPLGWRWIRNPWWRCLHLAIMGYIAFNALRGELCFLTIWEADLRRSAGQVNAEDVSFIGRVFRDMLYVEVPQKTLDIAYLVVAVLVLASVLLVRPHFRWRTPKLDAATTR